MADSKLFKPLRVGNTTLQHRIVMSPLSRFRADPETHAPLPMATEYYAQRASVPGTMIITEATFVSRQVDGYSFAGFHHTPGIYTREQVAAWREITDAVHAKGSFIWMKLWGLGRVADPATARARGVAVKGPSPIAEGDGAPAGFDGVELHGANGYLIDQFLQDRSNQRTDEYGGSVENRARFAVEVATAVVAAVGADMVGARFSPWSTFQGMRMADPVPQFAHVARALRGLGLAYLHLVEGRVDGNADRETTDSVQFMMDAWDRASPVLIAGGFDPQSARRAVDEEHRDAEVAVGFGRWFISNPDLPFRIEKDIPLTPYKRETFYADTEEGYTDYAFSHEFVEIEKVHGNPLVASAISA
ncbi:NADH:flavin oxidoreductase/NADH oxidase [Colletotrichum graminicola M1.001]|uniref:NADH:flavin oxidoreductase/NADH oxidase n=1 Tax=Colletotrichum graminicola (strain M1.001 / M2 / FGSC 10212) TaxID=645133 RepID=E3QZY3_COLGM|nr:NADH:flavin oxidoreductase/NADH oxidase [Colletotrichum graminicola M1.001]EFQ36421.1 NADH:flavin oxidoreductase/NADH oxidase [Colletotrichum graminicola M1.001]